MKTLHIKNFIAILGLALACVACDKEEHVETANIVMTTYEACSYFDFFFGDPSTAIIDWGDGSANDTIETTGSIYFASHTYNSENSYTVRVYGENMRLLSIYNNDLETLDVRSASLSVLHCYSPRITSLDLSKNTALTYLEFGGQIASIDLSKNTALEILKFGGQIASIDLSKNTALSRLTIGENQITGIEGGSQIASIDLSKNTALVYLNCAAPQLKSLGLSSNNKVLAALYLDAPLFTADKLNTLFDSLPFYIYDQSHAMLDARPGEITINNTPGIDGCDISIAEKKGWIVRIF